MAPKRLHIIVTQGAAKAPPRQCVATTEQLHAIEQPDDTELTRIFKDDTSAIEQEREMDKLFSIVDVMMGVTDNDRNYAALQIRCLRERFLEVNEKIVNVQLHYYREDTTPTGDSYATVELMIVLTGRNTKLVHGEASHLFEKLSTTGRTLFDQVICNSECQEHRLQDNSQHVTGAFGQAVKAAVYAMVEPNKLQQADRAVMTTTFIPAMTWVIDKMCAAKIDTVTRQVSATQTQWQQVVLRQPDTTICVMGCTSGRLILNVNTSTRHQDDLDKMIDNILGTTEAESHVRNIAALSMKFVRERWQHELLYLGVQHTSYTVQFSILMQAGCVCFLSARDGSACQQQKQSLQEVAMYSFFDIPKYRLIFLRPPQLQQRCNNSKEVFLLRRRHREDWPTMDRDAEIEIFSCVEVDMVNADPNKNFNNNKRNIYNHVTVNVTRRPFCTLQLAVCG